jgi:transposase
MLVDEPWRYEVTEFDRRVFEVFVAREHPLRKALMAIPWAEFETDLAPYYCAEQGQPAIKPLVMLKLEYLRYQHQLSDRQVIDRTSTDVSFRYFLQVGALFRLPDPSSLSRFRGRLGRDGFHRVFDRLTSLARSAGLVQDRLRLKDASHVVANIAVPTTLGLLGQIRDRLLSAAAPFDPEAAQGYRVNTELVRERTRGLTLAEQLTARVTHLQDILAWAQQLPAPDHPAEDRAWQQVVALRELAAKILHDQAHPDAGRRTVSVVDPEARRGKHGDWFDGYKLDLLMDGDSGFITGVNVLEAGGDEARDAVLLVRQEEAAHGNDIQALSLDGAGYVGEVLHELEDPEGLALETFVPPKKEADSGLFPGADFVLSEDAAHVTCPAGQASRYRQCDDRKPGWIFRFARAQCDGCPLVHQCLARPGQGAFGRVVHKTQYEPEFQRVRQRARTEEYARVRKEHPAVERKLNEVLNHHGGRHARYWGTSKILIQEYMTCFAVNLKRFVSFLRPRARAYA